MFDRAGSARVSIAQVEEAAEAGKTAESIFKRLKEIVRFHWSAGVHIFFIFSLTNEAEKI